MVDADGVKINHRPSCQYLPPASAAPRVQRAPLHRVDRSTPILVGPPSSYSVAASPLCESNIVVVNLLC